MHGKTAASRTAASRTAEALAVQQVPSLLAAKTKARSRAKTRAKTTAKIKKKAGLFRHHVGLSVKKAFVIRLQAVTHISNTTSKLAAASAPSAPSAATNVYLSAA